MEDILSLIPETYYDPSEVVLIGSHMHPSPNVTTTVTSDGKASILLTDENQGDLAKGYMSVRSDFANRLELKAVPIDVAEGEKAPVPTMALIYAYGYEGHSYRLAKPRIMIVKGHGEPYEATRDKAVSDSLTGQLYMWRLSKHEQTISIEVESGDLEKLVLEANQPGNRAVNSYAAHMQMAHRGGKLG
ncbi:hypothetical protein [Cognatishimia sp. F0-27]|uniref:hypothetical protein n=1 Tax=Cognatishimia sp. F0-27 TaxID=2816855 RepID=UPI001D0C71F4|nr:hypothetical protein [Cognatishimia sp. F0-27]MCC1491916.1 hypothetical protein [Cognatishimia sp. F0-27]